MEIPHVIEFDRVTVEYDDISPLNEISLTFDPGTTAVMGPSGSGKSTLLRLIAGLQVPSSGHVSINGQTVAAATWRRASDSRVSLIHQDYRLVPFLTTEKNLMLAGELRGARPTKGEVSDALDRVGLPQEIASRLPSTMSGGEQQRAALARALVAGGSVILADEPTGALDVDNTQRVADILCDLGRASALTIVVATHDPEVAARLDRQYHLADGSLAPAA